MEHKSYGLVIWSMILLAFGILLSAPAQAVGIGNDNPPGGGGNISAESRANAMAYVKNINNIQITDPFKEPLIVERAAPQPINVSVTNEAPAPVEQKGSINVRTVPTVVTGNVYPTAPCMGSSTVGAAALGWGASVGTSWSDHECGKRETARSFQNLGLTADAIAVLCSSEYAKVAPACKEK